MVQLASESHQLELIDFVNRLNISELPKSLTLGDYEPVLDNVECYDACIADQGSLLVARTDGLDVLQLETNKIMKSVLLEKTNFFSVDTSDENDIIVGITSSEENVSKGEIIVYNSELEQLRRWSCGTNFFDLAVIDGRIFLTYHAEYTTNIEVFLLNAAIPPCFVAIGDPFAPSICKQQITHGKKKILWKTEAAIPRCLCLDSHGMIWAGSIGNTCLSVLSTNGKLTSQHKTWVFSILYFIVFIFIFGACYIFEPMAFVVF
ncbi:hypothetical protein EB796_005036 [Bugula neritina]|uniref:Uncharacterized protein n=1 Tax=Bugula neritina TaxID=10212 RepID=A0A7J7KEK9_BUGNE|nr:hypothetical protein EB796_005036 [Bugula neritina]